MLMQYLQLQLFFKTIFIFQNTPIVKLKEFIEERTNVPTHQQRLTVGTTVLEDWDQDDMTT